MLTTFLRFTLTTNIMILCATPTCNELISSKGWTWTYINSELMRIDATSDEMFNLVNLTQRRKVPHEPREPAFQAMTPGHCDSVNILLYKPCIVLNEDILSWCHTITLNPKPTFARIKIPSCNAACLHYWIPPINYLTCFLDYEIVLLVLSR